MCVVLAYLQGSLLIGFFDDNCSPWYLATERVVFVKCLLPFCCRFVHRLELYFWKKGKISFDFFNVNIEY